MTRIGMDHLMIIDQPSWRWDPAKTSREEVFGVMILFLELLAREPETQVIIVNSRETPFLKHQCSEHPGFWDRSIGGHGWALLGSLEAAQPWLHQLHGGNRSRRFPHQVIAIAIAII